jgi:hypothetical protein
MTLTDTQLVLLSVSALETALHLARESMLDAAILDVTAALVRLLFHAS